MKSVVTVHTIVTCSSRVYSILTKHKLGQDSQWEGKGIESKIIKVKCNNVEDDDDYDDIKDELALL